MVYYLCTVLHRGAVQRFFYFVLQLHKLRTDRFRLCGLVINLILKLRKVICGGIAVCGSLEIFDRSPVLQSGTVLELFSGDVNERSVCTGA